MAISRRDILRLLDKLGGKVDASYLASILGITSASQIGRVEQALMSGNMDDVMVALGFRPGSFAGLTESIRQSYIEAGIFTVAGEVPKRFGMTFDWNNPRAEEWLRTHSSQLVTRINEEQREAIRSVMQSGVNAGRNPRSIALDLVGRVNNATGRREGGLVGLNGPQTNAALNARADLEALSENYFDRKLRDRRFDSIVRKAIDSDTPLSQTDINRLVGRYSDRLLKSRGDTIGRTEALSALNEASDESLRQVVDEGLAPPDAIERIWDSGGNDGITRDSHLAMEGQSRGLNEPFVTGNGALMMHPGDTSLGAGAGDVINCRCSVRQKIDFVKVELAA